MHLIPEIITYIFKHGVKYPPCFKTIIGYNNMNAANKTGMIVPIGPMIPAKVDILQTRKL